MIYFTSDTHFGHHNIIKYCDRPFDNVHTMDQVIIDNINNVVSVDDTLYILGDFCFKGGKPEQYLSRIVCQDIHLVLGNHDRRSDFKNDLQGFSSVQEVKEVVQEVVKESEPVAETEPVQEVKTTKKRK